MIKGFILPDWSFATEQPVNVACCGSFDHLQDLLYRIRPTLLVPQRCKQQMQMVGHNDGGVQIDAFAVLVNAVFKNQVPCMLRKRIVRQLAKRNE